MRKQIEIFTSSNSETVVGHANTFLSRIEAHNVVDVRYSSTTDTYEILIVYLVHGSKVDKG